jgi:hypothetical protein
MTKLKTILLCSALSVGLTTSAFSQQFHFQSDPYKFFPKNAFVSKYDSDHDGKIDTYWWDKNGDGIDQDDEVFYDIDEDGVPDISAADAAKSLKEHKFQQTEPERNIPPDFPGGA